MKLSIILPAYMEDQNLRYLLPIIQKEVSEFESSFEIIVVDTEQAMDETPVVCAAMNVRYVNRVGGNFYGDAIRTGLEKATGEFILFMDSDGSHTPSFIKKLYAEKEQADIIIASRYIEGGQTENSPILILMSRLVNWGYSFVLNINCKDVSNSFRLYRASSLRKFQLKCKNFDIVEEILYKIIKNTPNVKILEIPFCFKQRMFGETKRNLFSFIFTYLITLVRLRFS
jgi:dolichol-phosphate mannosyltransferase